LRRLRPGQSIFFAGNPAQKPLFVKKPAFLFLSGLQKVKGISNITPLTLFLFLNICVAFIINCLFFNNYVIFSKNLVDAQKYNVIQCFLF